MTSARAIPISTINTPNQRLSEEVLIGKDILELLTEAMYIDPLSIYREYIQNSADAIEEAIAAGLYTEDSKPLIEVMLNQQERSIKIRDNGIGVPRSHFVQRLTAIGGSEKRGAHKRGFRGVGRLSGLGYCQEVIFRSRSLMDNRVAEISWDGRRLRALLRDTSFRGSLAEAVREIAQIGTVSGDSYPAHFFEVELRGTVRIKGDTLLNEKEVRSYLSQVAPVPFHQDFTFGKQVEDFLRGYGLGNTFRIEINDGQGTVFRPYQDKFHINQYTIDQVQGIRFFELDGVSDGIDAVGWVVDHSYLGAIGKYAPISGIRLRAGNIQVGSADLLSNLFPESRFNSWSIGEIHILNEKIIPNGRRDDFEQSAHYQNLQSQFVPIARNLAKLCRQSSSRRNIEFRLVKLTEKVRQRFLTVQSCTIPDSALSALYKVLEQDLLQAEALAKKLYMVDDETHPVIATIDELRRELAIDINPTIEHQFSGLVLEPKKEAYDEVLALIVELAEDPIQGAKLAGRIAERLLR